jgi:hypothetical protein
LSELREYQAKVVSEEKRKERGLSKYTGEQQIVTDYSSLLCSAGVPSTAELLAKLSIS